MSLTSTLGLHTPRLPSSRFHDPIQVLTFWEPPLQNPSIWLANLTVVEGAREQVPSLINASPKEIFFTSGALESNKAIIKGLAGF